MLYSSLVKQARRILKSLYQCDVLKHYKEYLIEVSNQGVKSTESRDKLYYGNY